MHYTHAYINIYGYIYVNVGLITEDNQWAFKIQLGVSVFKYTYVYCRPFKKSEYLHSELNGDI